MFCEMLDHARGRIVLNLDIKDAICPKVVAATIRAGATDRVIVKNAAGISAAAPPASR
jgi:glycerophosphoryl diester phosphodiesterase